MKVVTDNHTIPAFMLAVTCHYCKSGLELNDLKDFHTVKVQEGMQWDSYDVTRLSFVCPLCGHETRITNEQEVCLPAAVVRKAKENTCKR